VPRPFRCAPAVVLIAGLALAAPEPTPAPQGPKPEEIQKAIADLASPRFAVREKASKVLWEAGAVAEPALRAAAKSPDEEIANRAKAILDKFDWGLYPDTPAEVVKLIEKFRGGDANVRQEAVGELMKVRPPRFATLRKLIVNEHDETARRQMYESMAFQAREAVPALILAGQLDEAGKLLEVCVSPNTPNSLTDYAAFHYLRNSVPAAVQRMEALRKGSEADAQRATEALVYLYRVRRDWPAARKMAELSHNRDLQNDLAWEASDWKALAEGFGPSMPLEADDRGARAAYHRLAGNRLARGLHAAHRRPAEVRRLGQPQDPVQRPDGEDRRSGVRESRAEQRQRAGWAQGRGEHQLRHRRQPDVQQHAVLLDAQAGQLHHPEGLLPGQDRREPGQRGWRLLLPG